MTHGFQDVRDNAVETADAGLTSAIARIRTLLEQRLSRTELAQSEVPPPHEQSSTLQRLCDGFQLSPFERDTVVLCAAAELDPAVAGLCAALQDDERRRVPTFRVALEVLPEAHWSALLPEAPLRHWRLLEVGAGETLASSPLHIEESVLHFLMGALVLDERLRNVVETIRPPEALPASYRTHAARLGRLWTKERRPRVVVQLQGNALKGMQALASAACAALGLRLYSLRASAIPASSAEREAFARLWQRDAVLSHSALLLDVKDGSSAEWEAASALADRIEVPLLVAGSGPLDLSQHEVVRMTIDRPKRDEQRALWQYVLGECAGNLNGELDAVVSHFVLDLEAIHAAGRRVLETGNPDGSDLLPLIWEACRAEARPLLEGRAQRIETRATWPDIVLPESSLEMLRAIAAHVRQQGKVLERWGFAAQSSRGLGLTVLFSGPSGTGKTLAAEIVANELRLDLYRIDLSQVASKYIGETEKNLRGIFDAAENSGAVLLFDEADALFGKRSEVKDSHDRYANIEVSYLLQRMEAYRGLAILTTNMRAALDAAFLRRIRFIVNFPFPDPALRRRIWERMFPSETPTSGLDLDKLARLNLPGGNIRNVALNAAFMAADEGGPVRMDHLLRSARRECSKLEKQLTGAEIGGWA